jgi:hypothetical protein
MSMDAVAQKAGEQQVKELLIEPLERLGLMKPSLLNKVKFDEMKTEICQRLAYMSALSLGGLCEELAGCGGGPQRDRFPLATVVLPLAMKHQPPVGDASPLMRAVFAHSVGEAALSGGYAPELMKWLRDNRKFPGGYVLGQISEMGRSAARRAEGVRADREAGRELSDVDASWLERRTSAEKRCEDARELGLTEKAKA